MKSIDLNCDMGEGDRQADLALLDIVSSASIACGGHAGDESTMEETIRAAAARGVSIGAHPSYPDRANFGRTELAMSAALIEAFVADQVRALHRGAARAGHQLHHVKPHGALYHAAMNKRDVPMAVAAGVQRVDRKLILVGLAGAPGLDWWREAGMTTSAEAFADRLYEPDGSLRSRSKPGALIADPATAAQQAVQMVVQNRVHASDGSTISIDAQTLCVHADTPGAASIARAVRAALEGAGVGIAPLS